MADVEHAAPLLKVLLHQQQQQQGSKLTGSSQYYIRAEGEGGVRVRVATRSRQYQRRWKRSPAAALVSVCDSDGQQAHVATSMLLFLNSLFPLFHSCGFIIHKK